MAGTNKKRRALVGRERRLRIGTDLDGVVIDHTVALQRAFRIFGYRLLPWQTDSNIRPGLVPGRVWKRVADLVYREWRDRAKIVRGSLPAIKSLGSQLVIASVQKHPQAEKKLWPWLKRHGILRHVPRSRIHILRTRDAKIRRIKKLKPDAFIDDGLDVIEKLPRSMVRILFDWHGVSRKLKLPSNVFVARRWRDVTRLLSKIGRLRNPQRRV